MATRDEIHDPDYPEASVSNKEETQSPSEEERIQKIKKIIRREFGNELDIRENEVMLLDQRMSTARRALHELRYHIVNSYYNDKSLQLTPGQIQDDLVTQSDPRVRAEISTLLCDGQRRIHPGLRKLLGKETVNIEEIFKVREPRKGTRKDYTAMLQKRHYTLAANNAKSLRPEEKPPESEQPAEESEKPKKIPRHIEPKTTSVITLNEATRNKMKHRYRIVIGNTSKYAPGASRADRSTHTWLLYVRGPPAVLKAVTVRLHSSYAPHHIVRLERPPFNISRRGWGEFPARVELHFAESTHNPPACIEHTIRLDRNYTGLQTLGAETLVDVWLYSTPDMIEFEHKEDADESRNTPPLQECDEKDQIKLNNAPNKTIEDNIINNDLNQISPLSEIKIEETDAIQMKSDNEEHNDSWLDFFSQDTSVLNVDEMFVKNIKKEIDSIEDMNVLENAKESDISENNGITRDYISNDVDSKYSNVVNPNELPSEILSQSTNHMKRIMKYIDPTTRKIYYLEMDRALDVSKVQEIVINSEGNIQTAKISPVKANGLKTFRKRKGVSLLKPEVKNLLKNERPPEERSPVIVNSYKHVENDHCYLRTNWQNTDEIEEKIVVKQEIPNENYIIPQNEINLHECLCVDILRFPSYRIAVNYLLKKIPLICQKARDPNYLKYFPFVVETEEKYWKLDFAKRRNIEWSRAKLINKLMLKNVRTDEKMWRTKQILIYSRLHGFYPIRSQSALPQAGNDEDWSLWNYPEDARRLESNIDEIGLTSDINSLTLFNSDEFLGSNSLSNSMSQSDSDEEIEIVKYEEPTKIKTEPIPEVSLEVSPVENEEDRLRFLFIERKCAEIGIELRNEDVGSGYSYSAVHAVMLSALGSFAEELVRSALAARLRADAGGDTPPVWLGRSSPCPLRARDVCAATQSSRLQLLSRRGLATTPQAAYPL